MLEAPETNTTSSSALEEQALKGQNSIAARVDQLEKHLNDSQHTKDLSELRSEVLQARQDVQDAAYSRLEIGIGLFGLLLTILVIAFGFRTEKAAARAAKGELADRQKELDEIISQSRAAAAAAARAAAAAESAASSADSHAKTAAGHAATAKAGADAARASTINVAESIAAETVNSAAVEEASVKSEKDLTSEDFRLLVLSSVEKEDWPEVIRLTREMQFNSGGSDSDYAFALFQEAFALGKVDNIDIEMSVYNKFIDMFSDHSDIEVKRDVAAAFLNRGISKQISAMDFTIADDFEYLVKKFSPESDNVIISIVSDAYFQIAASHAEKIHVNDCISYLRKWADSRKMFDCAEVTGKSYFDKVKDRPTFVKFLEEMGC